MRNILKLSRGAMFIIAVLFFVGLLCIATQSPMAATVGALPFVIGMAGLKENTTETYNFRTIVTKAANYTVTLSDEHVQVNGAYTMTLPVISSMQGTTTHKKTYKFSNIHATADATITAGSGNTIGGRASWTVKPNESIIIEAHEADTDWSITSPFPTPALNRVPFIVKATTSGTTAVNVFDSNGAPANIEILAVMAIAKDTNAGNVVVKNGTNTVASFAKSTTAGVVTGEDGGMANNLVAESAVCTVESSTTNGDAEVLIVGTMQTYV